MTTDEKLDVLIAAMSKEKSEQKGDFKIKTEKILVALFTVASTLLLYFGTTYRDDQLKQGEDIRGLKIDIQAISIEQTRAREDRKELKIFSQEDRYSKAEVDQSHLTIHTDIEHLKSSIPQIKESILRLTIAVENLTIAYSKTK